MRQRLEFSHKEVFGIHMMSCKDCDNDTCHICHKELNDKERGYYYCYKCYTKLHPSVFDYDDD